MGATDLLQTEIQVGNVVLVPCIVTAVSGGAQPTVTLTTKYKGFDGNTDSVGPLDAVQVVVQT